MAGTLIIYHLPERPIKIKYYNYTLNIISTINNLGHYARVVDHLAVKKVAQGAQLGGGRKEYIEGEKCLTLLTRG